MGRKLYMVYGSPPVNAVLMTARALNVDLELHEMDFANKEYLEDWFMKINPSHTVPTLDDNGFVLWDSHAILCYLAETYAKNDYLYSKDVKEKAVIHQILNLDCGTVFRKFSECIRPIFYENQKTMKANEFVDVYIILERILETSEFLAGNKITIADISVLTTIMACDTCLPICETKFPKLKKWIAHIEGLDFYNAGKQGLDAFQKGLKFMLES